jgi:methylglutaconyl-CoA hydratase
MEGSTIEFNVKNQVANLWLNRPQKRNALNADMLSELTGIFGSLNSRDDIRVLVIRGRGKVFSAGADLSLMSDISGKSETRLEEEATLFYDCFEGLYRVPVPVVCYAHGSVMGGANGLIAASDFALSRKDTTFSFSEVRLGLVPATVAPFVLRRMGPFRTRQCLLTGALLDGAAAYSNGLVDQLLGEENAEGEIDKLVDQLKKNAPEAVRKTKGLLVDIENQPFDGSLKALTTALIARARLSDEAREGLDAFFSKRLPDWNQKK